MEALRRAQEAVARAAAEPRRTDRIHIGSMQGYQRMWMDEVTATRNMWENIAPVRRTSDE